MRANDPKAVSALHDFQAVFGCGAADGLFPVEDPMFFSAPCKEVLWALVHEIPPEVAETDDVDLVFAWLYSRSTRDKGFSKRMRIEQSGTSTVSEFAFIARCLCRS